ncbi:hypothetical protein GQX73_g5748 [Xylaria multiplex]|uniref:Uncharacterized protein n=1 Tax=Xylaria multiplex TaxID=323545 RepID=A0A7C8ITR9_9PEZI|nr:hypothetical protein GQX73_g5748 [Xylaria multiplex]
MSAPASLGMKLLHAAYMKTAPSLLLLGIERDKARKDLLKDVAGNFKEKHIVNGSLRPSETSSGRKITAEFGDGYYTYSFTVPKSSDRVVLHLTNPSGDIDSNAPCNLGQTDFRSLGKKALIVRYGTGTDDGIFCVQEMLVKHLRFSHTGVDVLYFDVDSDEGPKKCTLGQDPPTVKCFQSRFMQLCAGAVAGDVRCLCVDAHGTMYPDGDDSGEEDAITSVIKNDIRRKRSVPTYSVLYNEAKSFIRSQTAQGQITGEKYKGPSLQGWKPVARDEYKNISYKDP